ncbi:MAG: alkaline phosphatase family protein [Gemmataceae bacterium]
MISRVRPALVVLVAVLGTASLFLFAASPARTPPTNERPKLAVLLVFDQLRGDYLARWERLFGDGGFRRLCGDGAWFQHCHYPYATTLTAPGHATISTGCPPETHGIVGNEWYDRAARKEAYCVGSDRHTQVPPPVAKTDKEKAAASAAPTRLLADTLADAIKRQLGESAHVVALSLKDRSAVLPGGRTPDACYWADKTGRFVTSTFYRDRPHDWVRDFNASRFTDGWLDKQWTRLRPTLDYAAWSGPDDVRGESTGAEQGRTFPHPFDGGKKKSHEVYLTELSTSPFGNEVLLTLAKRAIAAEGLGTRATPDFLSLSFSSNDLVGHAWGPDSQEVLDTTLRTDRLLKDLLAHLDAQVGRGRYTVVLTADHGVCPLPEVSRSRGLDARRVEMPPLLAAAEAFLNTSYPAAAETKKADTGKWIEATRSNMLYLNRTRCRERKVEPDQVAAALATWLSAQPGIARAIPRGDLLRPTDRDELLTRVRRSFVPDRSGDVMLVHRKYDLLSWSTTGKEMTGTTHGSPYEYDTHVPLLAMGPGIVAGTRADRVSPEHASLILAASLGVRPPQQARLTLPPRLFRSQ